MTEGLGSCLLCEHLAMELHHVTTWQLDADLVIPVCKSCHAQVHRAWREWGFDAIEDPALARVRRLQVLFVGLGYLDEPAALPTSVCLAIVASLGRVAEAWEKPCP
jgi:hypothetical protein